MKKVESRVEKSQSLRGEIKTLSTGTIEEYYRYKRKFSWLEKELLE